MRITILCALIILSSCYPTRRTGWERYKGKEKALDAYFEKEKKFDPIEGIYSVSDHYSFKSLILRQSKTKSKEHYQQVAIVKDENLTRNFIEVNLDHNKFKRYVVIADIRKVAKEDIYLFKQFTLSRNYQTLSFTHDPNVGVLTSEPFKKKGFRATKITRSLIRVSSK